VPTRIDVGGPGESLGTVLSKTTTQLIVHVDLTRIDVGGPGKSLGTITDKRPSIVPIAALALTRIAVGGVGRTYGTITDKAPGGPIIPRPGDIFTRIGVGGVGIHYIVTDKNPSVIPRDTNGYYGTGIVRERRKRDEEEILAIIMASYEVIH